MEAQFFYAVTYDGATWEPGWTTVVAPGIIPDAAKADTAGREFVAKLQRPDKPPIVGVRWWRTDVVSLDPPTRPDYEWPELATQTERAAA
jgi:hypothetical protein